MSGPGTEEPALIGATLEGAYRISRLIAKGGMSAVYEAVQLRLHQRVAVKVMDRGLASNPEALARFHREAEITSRSRHPHLVTVMDFGTAPTGEPFLVMEYLEGIDLDQRIRKLGRLPLATVVHIAKQVASALAAAHEQGIVHRDLKPANIFLVELPGEPDFAKILDFGISKVRAAGTQLTKASAIIGTPNYMSPEQATGMLDEVDHRADQWALACIVWEMLAGRAPFASDDMSAVFYQVIHLEPARLAKRAPDVPATVEAVLLRALSKRMEDRFPSIRDFACALEDAALGRPSEATAGVAAMAALSDPATARVRPDGATWVERRQAGRERRRSGASRNAASDTGRTGDHDLEAAVKASFGRKLRRIYAVCAVTIGLVVAVLVPLRRNQAANVAAPPLATAATADLPVAAPSPAAVVPTATPAVAAPVASEAKPKQAIVPARRPSKPPARPTRHLDDAIDPFAPSPPPSKPKASKAAKGDADFADPFAP